MRFLGWTLVAVTALAGCQRCGGGKQQQAVDGGTQAGTGQGSLHATDLRSAMIMIFPEYRGARVKGGRAALTREVSWSGEGDLADVLTPELKRLGWGPPERSDGGFFTTRRPLELEVLRKDGKVVSTIVLPLNDEVMNKLLHSPAPMGTEHLSAQIPRVPGETAARESFQMDLNYVAKRDRANFLVRSLVEDLMPTGWKPTEPLVGWEPTLPDGGAGPIPTDLDLTLESAHTGGQIEIIRQTGEVTIHYRQPLRP